jgi:hypothetical protein
VVVDPLGLSNLQTIPGRFGRDMGRAACMFGGDGVVLTIGKLGTTWGRREYYDAQVAAGAEGYYAGRVVSVLFAIEDAEVAGGCWQPTNKLSTWRRGHRS